MSAVIDSSKPHLAEIAELTEKVANLDSQLNDIKSRVPQNRVSIILLSGEFDKAVAAFIMANGAIGMGMEVTMYFTFWGCSVIKKGKRLKGKSLPNKLINLMLPGSAKDLPPSKMAFGGLGRKMFNYMMKNNMASLEEQIEIAEEAGVKFQVCAPSLGVMGFDHDEWVVPVDICGVAAMYEVALNARTAYFIS